MSRGLNNFLDRYSIEESLTQSYLSPITPPILPQTWRGLSRGIFAVSKTTGIGRSLPDPVTKEVLGDANDNYMALRKELPKDVMEELVVTGTGALVMLAPLMYGSMEIATQEPEGRERWKYQDPEYAWDSEDSEEGTKGEDEQDGQAEENGRD